MNRKIFVASALLVGLLAPRFAHADDQDTPSSICSARSRRPTTARRPRPSSSPTSTSKQKELDEKQEELKKMKEDLDKKAALMKPERCSQGAEGAPGALRRAAADIYARLQKDLAQKEQEATRGIFAQAAGGGAARSPSASSFAMVLEKNAAVVWGQPSLDITNEVIRMYNAGTAAAKKK